MDVFTAATREPGLQVEGRPGWAAMGDWSLAYDGRILHVRGKRTSAARDKIAHVLLTRYREVGVTAFRELVGDFVVCVRAPDGITCFRSVHAEGQIYYSATLASNRLHPVAQEQGMRPDRNYLLRFLAGTSGLQHCFPITPCQGVARLLPGHLLRLVEGRPPNVTPFHERRYSLRDDPSQRIEDIAPRIRDCLTDIVADHVASAPRAPVMCEISGGVDSSFVAALLGRLRSDVKGYMFSVPAKESHRPSEEHARQVAHHAGIPLTVVVPEELQELDPAQAMPHADEPAEYFWCGPLFGRTMQSLVPPNSLLFSGYGADQIFMRSPQILRVLLHHRRYPALIRTAMQLARSAHRSPVNILYQTALSFAPRAAYLTALEKSRDWRWQPFTTEEVWTESGGPLFIPWLRPLRRDAYVRTQVSLEEESHEATINQLGPEVFHDDLSYLVQPRLVFGPYVEPMGTDYISPFCDPRLTDFVYREVSWHHIFDWDHVYKHLLREAQRGIVPETVRLRPRDGFSFDGFFYGLLRKHRDFFEELLRGTDVDGDLIDRDELLGAFAQLVLGANTRAAYRVSALISYLLWWRDFRPAVLTASAKACESPTVITTIHKNSSLQDESIRGGNDLPAAPKPSAPPTSAAPIPSPLRVSLKNRITLPALYAATFAGTRLLGVERTATHLRSLGKLPQLPWGAKSSLPEIRAGLASGYRLIPLPIQCLEQSLVTWFVLNRLGHPATLKIGARLSPFGSHAWVDLHGDIWGDIPGREEFMVVAEYPAWT
jgi:asparagine synthase (glutamine-hydrolysing)